MKNAIFVSYRRDDTADAAGRIYDRLVAAFGENAVFKDVDTLPLGEDFGAFIRKTLTECRVVLALIGPQWLTLVDHERGGPRLNYPDDWVRQEIEIAMSTVGVQVVPVLVNGADMPGDAALPEALRSLRSSNAAQVRRDPDFHRDMDRLIDALKQGALTGTVVVKQQALTPAAKLWAEMKESVDVIDLRRFAEQFTGTEEGFLARKRADNLQLQSDALDVVNWNELSELNRLIQRFPDHFALVRIQGAIDELSALEKLKAEEAEQLAREAGAREREKISERTALAAKIKELNHRKSTLERDLHDAKSRLISEFGYEPISDRELLARSYQGVTWEDEIDFVALKIRKFWYGNAGRFTRWIGHIFLWPYLLLRILDSGTQVERYARLLFDGNMFFGWLVWGVTLTGGVCGFYLGAAVDAWMSWRINKVIEMKAAASKAIRDSWKSQKSELYEVKRDISALERAISLY